MRWISSVLSLLVVCSVSAVPSLEVQHGRNPLPTPMDLNGVAYGDGRFVAGGDYGELIMSTNGLDWQRLAPISNIVATIAFAGDKFIIGASGAMYLSEGGTDWVRVPLQGENASFHQVK